MRNRGSATVYMLLSLLLIMALLAGMFEAACSHLSRSYVRLYLDEASYSAMGEYYGPLWEEYGIYAIDTGFGGPVSDTEGLRELIAGYLPSDTGARVFSELKLVSCEQLTGFTGITGGTAGGTAGGTSGGTGYAGSDPFLEQILDAGRTGAVSQGASLLMEKLGVLTGNAKEATLLARRIETEQALAVLDIGKMDLMRLIDGVDISLYDGASAAGSFARKLLPSDPTMISAGINNESIFALMQPHYVNACTEADILAGLGADYLEVLEERDRAEAEVKAAEEALSEAEAESARLRELFEAQREETEGDEEEAAPEETDDHEEKAAPGEIDDHEEEAEPGEIDDEEGAKSGEEIDGDGEEANSGEEIEGDGTEVTEEMLAMSEVEIIAWKGTLLSLRSRLREIRSRAAVLRRDCEALTEELFSLVTETRASAVEARDRAAGLEAEQKALRTAVTLYQTLAAGSDAECVSRMRRYVGLDSGGFNPGHIRDVLSAEIELLDDIAAVDRWLFPEDDTEAVSAWSSGLQGLSAMFEGCGVPGIAFDYTDVSVGTIGERVTDLVEQSFGDLVSKGFLELLLSGSEISSARLENRYGRKDTDDDTGGGLSILPGITDALLSADIESLKDILSGTGQVISEKMALTSYALERFDNYTDHPVNKTTALRYEQEYLIAGHLSDASNLASVAARIFAIRLVPSLIYALSDSRINSEAEGLALATLSFTGVPFLVNIAKYLLITAVAAEQALVETSALLRGRSVPIVTDGRSFCVSVTELLTMTPTVIRMKAERFRAQGTGLTYSDHLALLLLLRDRDGYENCVQKLIEADLRYAYDDDLRLSNFITGFTVEVAYRCPLTLIPRLLTGSSVPEGYIVREEAEYHY